MSGAFLYLAIVIMWLCVLVPMWLRRDKNNLAELVELEEHYTGEHQLPDLTRPPQEEDEAPADYVDPRQFRARRRAIIVARRRRLLFFTLLLVVASLVTAALQLIPWWAVAPSGVIMLGYLAFLRMAVQVDRERRQRAARARERNRRIRDRRAAELAAQQAEAEIIEFEARQADVLFDQYAEPPRRAVGD
ncbi:divisome protein SepX/GlpR [Nonomuraea sp. SBT364]|uniref:divisome protein SepX/GlpR n=1 Tax=Nonomuraea sp. SBT364 TaxID=1580530 RepID=UPI0007C68E35|nr:hypothetical protein [Nonomuraea sp. SBT364]